MTDKKINVKKLSKLLTLIWTGLVLTIMVPTMWTDGQIWMEAVSTGNVKGGFLRFFISEYAASYWKSIVLLPIGWWLFSYGPMIWLYLKEWLYE